MRIVDLQPSDETAIEQAAHALLVGFRDHAPDAWPDLAAARIEVHEALGPGKICRIAQDDDRTVLGWVGGRHSYARVWELHPLVVHPLLSGAGLGEPWLRIWRCRYASAAGSPCCLAAMMRLK